MIAVQKYLAVLALTMTAAANAANPQTPAMTFDIKPTALNLALTEFAKQSGLQVVFVAEIGKDSASPGVSGKYTPQVALSRLLANTAFEYDFINPRTVTIRAAKPKTDVGASFDNTGDDVGNALRLALAETSLVADAGDEPSTSKAKNTKKSPDGVEEMIVEEGKIKPFAGGNVDIPRTINDVQPYYIFDSETIERSAAFNVEDFLKQRLTMNTAPLSADQQTTNVRGNTSQFDLRGLGADKTLVLVNGRRIPGPGGNAGLAIDLNVQADLNAIPLSAIERIEVLPSSASGIYGGGALGGVINVILKKNYSGGELRLSFDNTTSADAPRRKAGATYGFDVGKTQVMLSTQWSDGESLLMQDRRELFDRGLANILRNGPAFIYSSTSPFLGALPNITSAGETLNGVFVPDPGVLTLKNGGSLGVRNTYVPAGTTTATSMADLSAGLLRNAGQYNLDLPTTEQNPTGLLRPLTTTPTSMSYMISLRRELSSWLSVSLDLSRNENNSKARTGGMSTSATIPSTAAINPFTSAVRVTLPEAYSIESANVELTSDTATIGFATHLPSGWIGQLDYTWARNKQKFNYDVFDGTTFSAQITQGLFNPFVDLMRNPFALDERYLVHTPFLYHSDMSDIALRGSGPLPALPWGTPNLTVGMEHRVASTPENTVIAGLWPLRYAPILWTSYPREQATSSAYGEATVPLVRGGARPLLQALELQASARSERYVVDSGTSYVQTNYLTGAFVSYSGPTFNGKPIFTKATYTSKNGTVGFKYKPVENVTLRMSQATAFLPPTPTQLIKNPDFARNSLGALSLTTVLDPRNNNLPVQVATISGGNPDLTPQNSKSFNAGIIWEPSIGTGMQLRVNAEYYRIKQFDAIGSLPIQTIIDNEGMYGRVTRNSGGVIVSVDTSLLNLYRRNTQGWDLSVDYRMRTDVGTFSVLAAESIINSLRNQYSITLPEYDSVNFPSEAGAGKYKSNLQLMWDYRNWMVSWATRYFSSYKQYGSLGGPNATQRLATNPGATLTTTYTLPQGSDTVPSQLYHDFALSYAFDKPAIGSNLRSAFGANLLSGVTLQLGVKNVFDKVPPFDVYYSFYISPYGDTRLRSYWLSAKKAF